MVTINDLHISLTGIGKTENGKEIPLRKVGRVEDDIEHIDLCLWFDKDGLQDGLWVSGNKEHEESIKSLLGL